MEPITHGILCPCCNPNMHRNKAEINECENHVRLFRCPHRVQRKICGLFPVHQMNIRKERGFNGPSSPSPKAVVAAILADADATLPLSHSRLSVLNRKNTVDTFLNLDHDHHNNYYYIFIHFI